MGRDGETEAAGAARGGPRAAALALMLLLAPAASAQQDGVASTAVAPFANFESDVVRPLLLAFDDQVLLALNTPDHRLEVYLTDESGATTPELVDSVFTGLEPVSMVQHPTDPSRVFVANKLSDSVSVVDLARMQVVATLDVGDEPADVAVAAGRLFVTTARSSTGTSLLSPGPFVDNAVVVADVEPPYAITDRIELAAHRPRALAVVDGTVFVAPLNSGNHTTSLSVLQAELLAIDPLAPDFFEDPFVFNPTFLAPGLLDVPFALNPFFVNGWTAPVTSRILFDHELPAWVPQLPDNDVLAIDAATATLLPTVARGVGTTLLGMSARPGADELWVVNTDADNRTRFDRRLKGRAVENRITVVGTDGVVLDVHELAPPNTSRQHAQPAAVAFYSGGEGDLAFVASLGSSAVLVLDQAGRAEVAEIPVPAVPTGLVVDEDNDLLYVASRGLKAFAVFSISPGFPRIERPVELAYDPEPQAVHRGRGWMYEARTSTGAGNGNMSCATCHVFGDDDQLAWDLGDPEGGLGWFYTDSMTAAADGLAVVDPTVNMTHPMKGAMTTQTLRGLMAPEKANPLHWRGDRRFLQQFRGAFGSLLGGSGITAREMQQLTGFVRSLAPPPNPLQDRDRLYRGDALDGLELFGLNPDVPGLGITPDQPDLTCVNCHEADILARTDFSGTQLDLIFADKQLFSPAPLRNLYEKEYRHLTGFGLLHNGAVDDMDAFMDLVLGTGEVFDAFDAEQRDDMVAFVRRWDSGLSPLIGAQYTADTASVAGAGPWLDLAEEQARPPHSSVDVIAKATILDGAVPFRPVGAHYRFDADAGEWSWYVDLDTTFDRQSLLDAVALGAAEITFTVVPRFTGGRLGVDRDEDGVPDGVERLEGLVVHDPDSDDDGFDDGLERSLGSDPLVFDAALPADVQPPLVGILKVRDVFVTTASVRVVTDEPATLTLDVDERNGPFQATVETESLRRTHDVVLSGLPADTVFDLTVTARDHSGNAGEAEADFVTEPEMLHVEDILLEIVGVGPITVVARVTVHDHLDQPVPDVPVRGLWTGLDDVDWFPERRTDAFGVAVFTVPFFDPVRQSVVSFSPVYIGTDQPGDPWFVGAAGERPAFFYDQPSNGVNFRSVLVLP